MPETGDEAGHYAFGPFVMDVSRRRLLRDGTIVALTPKVFDLLLALVEKSGQMCSKDELLQILWPDVTVEENNLTHAMAKLRRALGDSIRDPRYVLTASGRGYRFIASVHPLGGPRPSASASAAITAPPERTRIMRLLVLPFRILKSDPDSDFLAFSLPDAITTSLCGFDSLIVRSSATAARFSGDPPDLLSIAIEAAVDAVLHGTLLPGGDDVRVSAQLVHVPDGAVLWSGTAQAKRGDVFQLQDALTRRIVDGLALRLTDRDERQLRRSVPANGRAYECYLRANQLGRDARHLRLVRDLYMQAVEEDPEFAPAWAGLGRIQRLMGKYSGADQTLSNAESEASLKRALELNPDLGLAHGLYAYIEGDAGRAMDAMVRLLKRPAVETDPELLAGLVQVCRYCGLLDESIAIDDCARRLDPTVRTSVAQTYWARRDFEAALEADIDNPSHVTILSTEALGRPAEAIALARTVLGRQNTPQTATLFLSAFKAVFEDDRPAAKEAIDRCLRMPFFDPEGTYRMAWVLARLRRDDEALAALRRSVGGGYWCAVQMDTEPWFDPLRRTKAFSEILQRARENRTAARAAFDALGGDRLVGRSSFV